MNEIKNLIVENTPVKVVNHSKEKTLCGAVLVVGAGISGIQASLDLANAGFYVYLLEESPAVGGRMARLDKTFPTGDCATCIISPKLVECIRDKNIEVITLADIVKIDGEAGNFRATIKQRPRFVDITKCTGCGDCTAVCPVDLASPFDEGMGVRKGIDKFYAQAAPNAAIISKRFRAPCSSGCPIDHSIQAYVTLIAKAKFKEAAAIIRRENPLAEVCGRVCFHPCESNCNRGEIDEPISICRLKRFVLEKYPETEPPAVMPSTGKKVAIIGSGPAGLSAAHSLVQYGHEVVIHEALPLPGGMLAVGIPDYRLPPEILKQNIESITSLGVKIKTNTRVGTDITMEQLQTGFDAVYCAVGAHESRKLNIKGEETQGVLHGVEFLRKSALKEKQAIGEKVVVVGGGNVAIDVALTAIRLGAKKVDLVCLESREEMPAFDYEIEQALEEGVIINNGWGPLEVLADNNQTSGITFIACTSVFDDDGRFNPSFDDSIKKTIDSNTVIIAIGQKSDLSFLSGMSHIHNGRTIQTDPLTFATALPGIFAGGDAAKGPASVIESIDHGKNAAMSIHNYLTGKPLSEGMKMRDIPPNPYSPDDLMRIKNEKRKIHPLNQSELDEGETVRPVPEMKSPQTRISDFSEVESTLSEEDAIKEAARCLGCGGCCECKLCEDACKADAILHDQTEKVFDLQVGAVLLTPGFTAFDPLKRLEYGSGFYKNVITNLKLERILSASGPTRGAIIRPSDNKHPKTLAFIQCVGSRDAKCGNEYCSSVCCMAATKEAIIAKEHEPGLDVTIFYMDLRAYGKDFDRYYERAQKLGIHYIRCRPSSVEEIPETGNLCINYIDRENQFISKEFDMVVLSLGIEPSEKLKSQADCIGIALNKWGFAYTDELAPLDTSRPGIYVAGAFQEPKDIPDTVMQASGAAARVMSLLAPARGSLVRKKIYPNERDITDETPRIGIFVCHCGSNIASVVDVETVANYAKTIPYVAFADHAMYVCSDDTQDMIKEKIIEHNLNRVVVASCTPRTHEPIFRDTLKSAGLNQYLLEMANIRDQCSWVHSADPEAATKKAKDLIRMIAGRVKSLRALEEETIHVYKSALVIGGGIAGMTAALALAGQGFPVHLVEKSDTLGGTIGELYKTLDGNDLKTYLADIIRKVEDNNLITLYKSTEVMKVDGTVGEFTSILKTGDNRQEIKHGVVIVATGAVEKKPASYGYNESDRVITQLELSGMMAADELSLPEKGTVIMVQCVEQRNEENPYCSRVCCASAIKNALLLKEKYPGLRIIILYRDIRTYGFSEIAYQKARSKGILFEQYNPDAPPVVTVDDAINFTMYDSILNQTLTLHPDLVILSAPIVPRGGRQAISDLLRVPLNADGFFLEAHVKLRPVDFASEGLYLCGTAHAPKFIKETIAQSHAVASRAAGILSKKDLPLSGQIAWVDQNKCISCMTCVNLCPYNAPRINNDNKAEVQSAVCMGCGSCTAECPAKAITLRHYTDSQVIGAINNLLLHQIKESAIVSLFPENSGIAQPRWQKG
ncbi:MAG: FAD-dependent oxidoreductase [Spirochaetales bacterium]|nr:FAD-dependent oxidoreductase [Spirochaetales bacterium]